jgi:23S rRNA G2445 N2-methylase RlmL
MKSFMTTNRGMEHIASLEVNEALGCKSKTCEDVITFDISGYSDLFRLCYTSQSARKICLLLYKCSSDDIVKSCGKAINNMHLGDWLDKDTSFKVLVEGDSKIEKNNSTIEGKLGELVIDHIEKKFSYKQPVDLVNPSITLYGFIRGNKFYFGIDFAGIDLSKRKYKIYSVPTSMKGTIAYGLVRSSGFDGSGILLDCFTGSGEVAIEAAMFASGLPVNYFNREAFAFLRFSKYRNFDFEEFFDSINKKKKDDIGKITATDQSMKHISYAKKNSKIAGVDKMIAFSRLDVEWLDTRFKKSSIDRIIARLPMIRGGNDSACAEFLYQAEFILKKNGILVLVGGKESISKNIEKYNFKIIEKKAYRSGKREYTVFILSINK